MMTRDHGIEPFELLDELARLALALEHAGRKLISLTAFDPPIRVGDGPV